MWLFHSRNSIFKKMLIFKQKGKSEMTTIRRGIIGREREGGTVTS